MIHRDRLPRLSRISSLAALGLLVAPAAGQPKAGQAGLFAKTFDTHWERLRDDYPYFELYGVDWIAERKKHRPLALAAENATEFAWAMARLIATLPDPHVSFRPSLKTIENHWSAPKIKVRKIQRRLIATSWPEDAAPAPPEQLAGTRHAYPEIIGVAGEVPGVTSDILASGPAGSTLKLRLRWPDGSEIDHSVARPEKPNLPPPPRHFGKGWLISGKVGAIGYMRIKTFSPKIATLGPDGKMTTMLRAALAKLQGAKALILDLQGNGGGVVAASDPFLGNLVQKSISYRWGRSGGRRRTISPRTPHYGGKIVALVDARSASGGEWAARILRDAGRAVVVGERTAGAEAAVHTSNGPDGAVVNFSAWPMTEPGVKPFQEEGIDIDYRLPLTLEDVRKLGFDKASRRILRARYAKALELLGAPASDLDALVALAKSK